jgi:hypothetical protein
MNQNQPPAQLDYGARTFQEINRMYEEKRLGNNNICVSCKKENEERGRTLSRPLSIWHIGNKYESDEFRLLLVGKVARGDITQSIDEIQICDARAEAMNYLKGWRQNPFWRILGNIPKTVYKTDLESAIDRVAITNLIKCNNAMDEEGANPDGTLTDQSIPLMKTNCLDKIAVFWEELKILRPKNVIFFTGWDYDNYLRNPQLGIDGIRIKNNHREDSKLRSKALKDLLWWDREFYKEETCIMRTLRTYHPGYLCRNWAEHDVVKKIAGWIRDMEHYPTNS